MPPHVVMLTVVGGVADGDTYACGPYFNAAAARADASLLARHGSTDIHRLRPNASALARVLAAAESAASDAQP